MTETQIARSAPRTMIRDKGTLKSLLESEATQSMMKNVSSQYMTEDRIAKAALLALSRQPKLAQCTTVSFLTSMMKAAQLGLDFSGATGQAYLIPFKQECTLIVGYQGMIEVAYRSKNVEYIDAQLVYENDECVFNLGTDPKISHVPCFDGDRGEVKFGYAVARLKGVSIPKIELMSKAEIMAIKARSRAKDSGPWRTDEPEMMRKTIIRRIFKYLPKTQDILTASEVDNMQYDYGKQVAEDVKVGVAGLRDRIKDATPSKEQTRPVESTVKDTKEPEPKNNLCTFFCPACSREYRYGAKEGVGVKCECGQANIVLGTETKKRKGRPKGSKNKSKETATPEPEPQTRARPEVPEFEDTPEPQPEEIQQEQPDAGKLDDYLYVCLNPKCGRKFDTPLVGKDNKPQCPGCFSYNVDALADQRGNG